MNQKPTWTFSALLDFFTQEGKSSLLSKGLHGVEKESLRVNADGSLALTPHPAALGSSYNNPQITTDFSESQLEMITPPLESIEETLAALKQIHQFVTERLGDEYIWPFSMPCNLPKDDAIPIAYYGESEAAQKKVLYRKGLAARYGKKMQMLSGVHYNTSFSAELWQSLHQLFAPETELQSFINESHLRVVRNFIRHRWLLIYLFGASPTFHESYKCPTVKAHMGTAIALRMSKCGYANSAKVDIDYNSFNGFMSSLQAAIDTPYPPYKAFEGQQLNDHILQIANEYYFPIRMKPGTDDFLEGLKTVGVRYLEVRLFDLNPLEATGVTEEQLYFTHLFLLMCLLHDSPTLSPEELQKTTDRQQEVALKGRGTELAIQEWAKPLMEDLHALAKALPNPKYEVVLNIMEKRLQDPSQLPSHKVIHAMEEKHLNFIEFGMEQARRFKQSLLQ